MLVAALVGDGPVPAGFAPARVKAMAVALAAKRARGVAKAWPALARELGDRFGESFATYARAAELPRDGGPLADGRGFARWLQASGALPRAGRIEALAIDLRYRATPRGLRRRRGPAMKVAWIGKPSRLVLALRLPWVGEYWLRFSNDHAHS